MKRKKMDIFELKAEPKEQIGRRQARRMRAEGRVPAVVYGHGENLMCTVAERDLKNLLITPRVYLIALSLGGKVEPVVLKEVQYHPVSDRPLHLDFYRYSEDEPLEVAIPVVLQGYAKGVKAGGKLQPGARRVRVKGLPADLPNYLAVDVTNLTIGEVLLVGDLSFDKLEVVDTKTIAVAAVRSQRAAAMIQEEEEAEAATEEGGESAEESAESSDQKE